METKLAPLVMKASPTKPKTYWWQSAPKSSCHTKMPQPGENCPTCHKGQLAYDGLFILTCDACGQVAESGGFT